MLHRKEDRKLILRYVLPSISAMVVSCTYNVVDGIFVGQGVGENALAATNLTVPFTEITTALASMLTMGGATVMAIRKGRGDDKGANHAFLTSVLLVAVIGITMMLIGAAANIFLDWLFVFPLKLGLKGAAIASGLGQLVACLVLSVHFMQKRGILRFEKYHLERALVKKVFTRGLPEFVIQMSQPITIFCYNRVILGYLSESELAAFSACTFMLIIVFGVYLGVSQGIQPLIGNSFGEQRTEDVQYFFRAGLKLCFGITTAVYILYVAFGRTLLTLFIRDAGLIPTAYSALRAYGFSTLLASLNIIFITYFLSTKNTMRAMVIACSRGIVLNSACVFVIPAIFGKESIWFPMIVAELVTLVIAVSIKRAYKMR